MEEEKKNRTIIKCKDCGYKYYEGDVHKCVSVRVVDVKEKTEEKTKVAVVEEKTKDKKEPTKTRKESFKMWNVGG